MTPVFRSISVTSPFWIGFAISSDVGLFELNAATISFTLITKLIVPQTQPKTTRRMWTRRQLRESLPLCVLLYMRTGRMKASAVHANEPTKLIKRPNFGTTVAIIALKSTISVRKNSRLVGR